MTVLIGQTTLCPGEYRAIAEKIKEFFPNLEIKDSICQATVERQRALQKLCAKVDGVIIVGGRGSANTGRLLSLALAEGKPAWIAESAEDITPEVYDLKCVGISSGASTPEEHVREIEAALAGGP